MDGSIGCMVNGAGLAMATMDIITLNGGRAANFLDLGGGVGPKQVSAALKILESDSKVKTVFVNVFGGKLSLYIFVDQKCYYKRDLQILHLHYLFAGIVNCVTIAQGIITACKENPPKYPLIVRLQGTNADAAQKLLRESGLPLTIIKDVDEAAKTAVKMAQQMKDM